MINLLSQCSEITYLFILITALLLPVLTSLITVKFFHSEKTKCYILISNAAILILLILLLIIGYQVNGKMSFTLPWPFFEEIYLSMNLEPIGLIFASMVSILAFITYIYIPGYLSKQNSMAEYNHLRKDLKLSHFMIFVSLAISATLAIGFSGNLITTFIFYEILTLATYPLIACNKTEHSRKAAKLYLITLLSSSILLFLPAIIYIYIKLGSLNFVIGGIVAGKNFTEIELLVLLFCIIWGCSKVALMPLHQWLPAAMVAPAPVSAILHAVAVVKSGIIIILKIIIYIFGTNYLKEFRFSEIYGSNILTLFLCALILISTIIAIRQESLKKFLAYSTITNLYYCLLTASIFHKNAMVAALFHLIAHSIAKIGLFFAAGSIYVTTHKTQIKELNGMGKLLPKTIWGFLLCSLSMIAIPPTAGFLSKFLIFMSLSEGKIHFIALSCMVISSIIYMVYFTYLIYIMYFRLPQIDTQIYEEPSLSIELPIIIAASLTILIIIFSRHIMGFILNNPVFY